MMRARHRSYAPGRHFTAYFPEKSSSARESLAARRRGGHPRRADYRIWIPYPARQGVVPRRALHAAV